MHGVTGEDAAGSMLPLAGGHSGRTFLSEVGGVRSVVRIYPPGDDRGLAAPEVDAAVMHLVRGLVPVPDVLEVRRGDGSVPGLLVTRFHPGQRGDQVLAGADEVVQRRMGESMGRLAATLAGMPTPRSGAWSGPGLSIEPFDLDLPAWVDAHAAAWAHWSTAEQRGLGALAERAEEVLGRAGRTCVVHSDLNPKNVLVDPDGTVTLLVDWEFSHSGHPATDLGNVLRLDRHEAYVDAAVSSYVELRGGTPSDVLTEARSADLWALVELAARRGANPVADRAHDLLRAAARTGDVHAWPQQG